MNIYGETTLFSAQNAQSATDASRGDETSGPNQEQQENLHVGNNLSLSLSENPPFLGVKAASGFYGKSKDKKETKTTQNNEEDKKGNTEKKTIGATNNKQKTTRGTQKHGTDR